MSIYVSMNIIGGTSEDTIRQGVVRRKSRVCTAAVRSRKKKNGQTHARNGERERGREREENLCTTNPCNHHHHLPLGLGGRSLPGCVYCVRTAETARVRYVTRSSQVGIIHRQWSGPGANRGISLGRCPFDYYPPPPPTLCSRSGDTPGSSARSFVEPERASRALPSATSLPPDLQGKYVPAPMGHVSTHYIYGDADLR